MKTLLAFFLVIIIAGGCNQNNPAAISPVNFTIHDTIFIHDTLLVLDTAKIESTSISITYKLTKPDFFSNMATIFIGGKSFGFIAANSIIYLRAVKGWLIEGNSVFSDGTSSRPIKVDCGTVGQTGSYCINTFYNCFYGGYFEVK